ncbi:LysE family translocator [Uliginosibacterium paludis]|uniref:LysE family translocator n=1 Tax=Uliginosibacterium paludis TaxID=1615952 RepID=A0ABV2CP73_9RHOO
MIPVDVILLFIAASAALSVAPGPDNLFVLTQSALHGRRTGLIITLGLCSGLLFHISAVALGVAAILKSSALAFNLLKMAGAGYLLYLAWKSFTARPSDISGPDQANTSGLRLYARGIVMNITNPKVAIFFLAFLPQFTDPARGPVPQQVMLLGLLFMLTALVIFGLIAWAASLIGAWLKQSDRAQQLINRIAGGIFVALACRLAFSSNR